MVLQLWRITIGILYVCIYIYTPIYKINVRVYHDCKEIYIHMVQTILTND